MAAFTIFKNAETGKHVAVYDHQLPTQTGIGSNEKMGTGLSRTGYRLFG